MSELFPISPHLNNAELLQQTVDQIKKDFERFQLEVNFIGNNTQPYEELFRAVYLHVAGLLGKDYQRLLNILYRIDLPEQVLKKKLLENKPEDLASLITELIIKRELQKVVIKNYYKQHGNQS